MKKSLFMSDCSEGDYGKEAILDYELSWVLRLCAERGLDNALLKRNCLAIMSKLLGGKNLKDGDVTQVKVWKQWQRIDLVAEIMIGDSFHILTIEDKAYTAMSKAQRDEYPKAIKAWYAGKRIPKENLHYVVVSMFDSDQDEFAQLKEFAESSKIAPWRVFSAWDFDLGVTGNELFDDFWINEWRTEE